MEVAPIRSPAPRTNEHALVAVELAVGREMSLDLRNQPHRESHNSLAGGCLRLLQDLTCAQLRDGTLDLDRATGQIEVRPTQTQQFAPTEGKRTQTARPGADSEGRSPQPASSPETTQAQVAPANTQQTAPTPLLVGSASPVQAQPRTRWATSHYAKTGHQHEEVSPSLVDRRA